MAAQQSRILESVWFRYSGAIVLPFIAMAVQMLWVPLQTLTVIFVGAVAITARWLGFRPALISTAVSVLLLDRLFLLLNPSSPLDEASVVRLIGFAAVSILIASVARQRSLAESTAQRFGAEKEQTMQALADREERLRIGLMAAGMGTWRWEIDSDHDMRDASYNAMLGLPPVETIQPATDFFERVYPEDRSPVQQAVDAAIHDGADYDVEFRMRRMDGTYIWVRDKGKVFRDEAGKPLYITGAVIDVTDRKIEQKQLRESRERFKRLADVNMIGICFWTADGKIIEANDEYLRILGLTREQFERQEVVDWRSMTPPEWHAADAQAIRECQQTGVSRLFEKEYVRADGTRVPVVVGVAFLSGSTFDGLGFVMDITERKRAEQALLRQEKLASAGRLAATIAHEINNPLEAVTNLLYLAMRDPALPPSLREMIKLADEELQRVTHTAKQTLGFYRETTSARDVDVVQALEDVLTLYARRLEQRAVKVQTEFRARPVVRAFGGELRQIFSNVVNNAADAMPAGGAMRVRVSEVRRAGMPHVRISFADRGTGIAAQQISHIFEPFFTTKRDVGTGLGLWVTKELVEKHGGWITVRSTTDATRHGTVFSIILPQEVVQERATA